MSQTVAETSTSRTMDLSAIQTALRENKIDGWLFYDHHYRDPLAYRILGLGEGLHVTRRWFYFLPANGEPKKLVHRIESGRLDSLPGTKTVYSSWQELEAQVAGLTAGATKIAMQYSPRNAIMYVSMVDAGTVEMVRGLGKEVVSSADLVSQFEAVLNDEQITTHYVAQQKIDAVLEAGWQEIGRRTRAGGTHEFAMVEFLSEAMGREGMVWEHGPNVSAGANSADSHYEPTAANSKPIRKGDFVLIDIWGKLNRPDACYYDITWTGVVDREPTPREQMVFETVRDARDAAVKVVREAFAARTPIAGWQADDAARDVIARAAFGEWFTHRTGHNIGTELHGNGANLDNLETHDERLILPKTCFSVEPGLYFPGEFGVRSEVDMIAVPGRAEVTGRVQRELVRI
ncbi:M24 family metallopeptidase [Edaphobacter modestus]|uniref:Xaa-Pro aminopeptidase n=1 Tax=Edaphobacter modestus TaxID=388466 RepID=A0A4Q7YUC8_9BACT|nr:Xaa-Pro peptidase family protein [Edaphobacter modestus]RZU40633.1 Xaa-Pro aminopeptidase [Edaphobacter modestus]